MKKASIVTGGANGLGLEFVKILLNDGYHVIVIDKEQIQLSEFLSVVGREYKYSVTLMTKDLSQQGAAKEIYEVLKNRRIEVLINNAGFGLFGKFHATNWEREESMINLHVMNTTHLTKLFLQDMLKRDEGKILNMASLAGFQPGPLMSVYYASKAYILHFTEAIANEIKGTGVSISVLCPGQTKTNFQVSVSSTSCKNKIGFNVACPVKVAKYGYKALLKGDVVVIPGVFNKFLANLNRFLRRSTSTAIVRRIQEKNRDSMAVDNSNLVRQEVKSA